MVNSMKMILLPQILSLIENIPIFFSHSHSLRANYGIKKLRGEVEIYKSKSILLILCH